jgi:hypothetical protein
MSRSWRVSMCTCETSTGPALTLYSYRFTFNVPACAPATASCHAGTLDYFLVAILHGAGRLSMPVTAVAPVAVISCLRCTCSNRRMAPLTARSHRPAASAAPLPRHRRCRSPWGA